MEKPLCHYFQVLFPYHMEAQCNQKTPIPVSSRWQTRSEKAKKSISINTNTQLAGSTGYDLHSVINTSLIPFKPESVKTGDMLEIPTGFYAKVVGRSGLAFSGVSTLRHWNTGLVSSRVSLTSWGEGASLALVGHPSGDGVTVKIYYGVDVFLHRPALYPIFPYWVDSNWIWFC